MFSLYGYGQMVADARADAYAEALRRVVRPGSVVVDLGAGTGVWTMFACARGARRVYAIEPGDVIAVAMDVARANGFDDRITFVQCDGRQARVDEAADVVVADLRDVLPIAGQGIAGMIDARRFLRPGGVLIPQRDTLWVAAVSAPTAYASRVGPWEDRCFGLDFTAARRAALGEIRKERFRREDLLTAPARWAEVDYRTADSAVVSGQASLAVEPPGTAHGLAVWFEGELVDGVRLVNRPGDPPVLYGQAFFPWPRPVDLPAGGRVDVRIRATPAGAGYIIQWDTTIAGPAGGSTLARFTQSTLDGQPLSLATLRRVGVDAIVTPGEERDIERLVLDAFDGVRPHGEIALALRARFPGRFSSQADALARVEAISLRLLRDGDGRSGRD